MKAVIVKCKLKSRDDFEKRLSDIDMDFGPMYWQHERVYVPRNYQKRSSFPRLILRTEMKAVDRPARYELILRRHIEDSKVDVIASTVIKDYTEAATIILQLGFEEQAEISRRRQEILLGAGTKLYLDKIDGVGGYFAKIESKLEDGDNVKTAREELIRTFESLGQPASTVVDETYSEIN